MLLNVAFRNNLSQLRYRLGSPGNAHIQMRAQREHLIRHNPCSQRLWWNDPYPWRIWVFLVENRFESAGRNGLLVHMIFQRI
jgi:hypothetical protein